jgi:hypothetical protein
MSDHLPQPTRRRGRRRLALKVGSTTLAAGIAVLALGTPAFAHDTSSASDPRATFYEGNVTSCAGITVNGTSLSGDSQLGSSSDTNASNSYLSGTVSTNSGSIHTGQGQELDVAIQTGANVVVDAVVVKGGDGYNVYSNPAYLPPTLNPPQHYISPFNGGGNVPTISHWFVCYEPGTQIPVGTIGGVGLAVVAGLGLVVWQRRRHHTGSSPAAA